MKQPFLFLLTLMLGSSCFGATTMPLESGVSLTLAQARSAAISELSYSLHIRVPGDPARPLHGSVGLKFVLARSETDLQIDFRHGEEQVLAVRSQGKDLPYTVDKEHIVLPAQALAAGRNAIEIDFESPQDSVNRNPEFLFTLFVPDRARNAFPLFDQPDLKARYRLTLDLPSEWRAMSNAVLESEHVAGERRVLRFAATDPMSSYLFSFVAGKFEEVTRQIDGRTLTLLHRETDAQKVSDNLDAIFQLHADSLTWLETYTGIDYPFQKFAFALIPDFPYGGMEHVGAIQYRASSLFLDESPSENQLLRRAQLIAHETAHMWFGNLVTMRWFNDVWTKEVFANFMAGKIVNPQFPNTDHELNFLVSHYPQAYAVDRTAGANAIRQELGNLNLAGQMYGPIIYHKAPIMMRQLELLLGEADFRDGIREYLAKFAFGNASWPGLIEILDKKTEVSLAHWSEIWVNSPGMPTFRLDVEADPASGQPAQLLVQSDPHNAGRLWPQTFSLWSAATGRSDSLQFSREDRVPLAAPGEAIPEGLLLNADGRGYGRFPTSLELFDHWFQLTPLQRGVLLINSFETLISEPFGDPLAQTRAVHKVLTQESNALLIDLAGDQLLQLYFGLLNTAQRNTLMRDLEESLWATLLAQPTPEMTKLYFELCSAMALSDAALARLHQVWTGELVIDQLVLQEPERIALAERLALRMPARSDEIIDTQIRQISNPDRRRRLEFIAPALSADLAVRDRFFRALAEPQNRATEVWVAAAVGYLHDPTRLDHAIRYIQPSLELLEEIQVTGDIFFPSAWLGATLGSHGSSEAAAIVQRFLQEKPDYNPQLRMKILQAADPLFRASRLHAARAAQ